MESKKTLENYPVIWILISTGAFSFLFFFNTNFWLNLIPYLPNNFFLINRLFTNWGLYLFYIIFAFVLVFSLVHKNRTNRNVFFAYLKTQLIFAFAIVRLLKIIVGRSRPLHGIDNIFLSFNPGNNSFPSGHAADAFVSGIFLYYLLKNSKYSCYRFLPLVYAYLIGLSRILSLAHYPLDVLTGIFIGILGSWFFIARIQKEPATIY